MEFLIKTSNPEQQTGGCLVVSINRKKSLAPTTRQIDQLSNGYLSKIIKQGDISGKLGSTLLLHDVPNIRAERVLLVGTGDDKELDEAKFRKVIAAFTSRLKITGCKDAIIYLAELNVASRDSSWKTRQITEIASQGLYLYQETFGKKPTHKIPLKKITIHIPSTKETPKARKAVKTAQAISKGCHVARTLGNLPGNICTPSYLAQQAKSLASQHSTLATKVLGTKQMEKLKMGAILSVAKGSDEEPKFIIMEYNGGKANQKPHVLVGKGVTFDTGGISIKPSNSMDEMKFDMCGAASVMGTMTSVVELNLPLNVIGIISAAENMPSGRATKPGDIITSMSGQTIEIINTDAEGRLVLCDALSYVERYKPASVVDIATLTGACIVALGHHASAMYSNNDNLARNLLSASDYSHDRIWQMPLWDDYQHQLDSNFADFVNSCGRDGGSITAACFLSRFTKKYRWAHLDIAGIAWKTGKNKGATGKPVPLLVQYLLDRCGN